MSPEGVKIVRMVGRLNQLERHRKFREAHMILVDEGHFFGDIAWTPDLWAEVHRKTVVVAGLTATHERTALLPMVHLMAQADVRVCLEGLCSVCGAEAGHTARTTPIPADGNLMGGSESYQPVCRLCFPARSEYPVSRPLHNEDIMRSGARSNTVHNIRERDTRSCPESTRQSLVASKERPASDPTEAAQSNGSPAPPALDGPGAPDRENRQPREAPKDPSPEAESSDSAGPSAKHPTESSATPSVEYNMDWTPRRNFEHLERLTRESMISCKAAKASERALREELAEVRQLFRRKLAEVTEVAAAALL